MQISKQYRFVFIDIPKTASLTLDTVFSQYGSELERPPKNSKLGEKHCRVIPDWAKDYTKITCVRNPFERICSFYHFMKQQDKLFEWYKIKTFDDFIDRCLEYNDCPDDEPHGYKYRMFPMWKYLKPLGYDILLRQEYLKEDLQQLSFIDNLDLPTKNRNENKLSWADEYTEERRKKIIEWAGNDFDLFNYSRDYTGYK